MKNFVQAGHTVTMTAGSALTAGSGVLFGSLFGVVAGDAANGAEVEIQTVGVFDMTKSTDAGSATTVGAKVYWDDTNKVVTGDATSNTLIGLALTAVVDGGATQRVLLTPGAA